MDSFRQLLALRLWCIMTFLFSFFFVLATRGPMRGGRTHHELKYSHELLLLLLLTHHSQCGGCRRSVEGRGSLSRLKWPVDECLTSSTCWRKARKRSPTPWWYGRVRIGSHMLPMPVASLVGADEMWEVIQCGACEAAVPGSQYRLVRRCCWSRSIA